jgi:hypothetical protein
MSSPHAAAPSNKNHCRGVKAFNPRKTGLTILFAMLDFLQPKNLILAYPAP